MSTSVTLNPSVTNVTVSNTDAISVDLTTDSTTVELTNGVILPQALGTGDSPTFAGINVTGTVTAGDTTVNGSFTVNNILFTNTDLNATEFEAAQGKRIVRQSGTANKTFALFQPAAANVGQTWTILNSSSGIITLDADSQYFHILDGVTLAGKQADWAIKRGGVVDIICIGSLANGGSQSFPNFVIYGSGIIEL